MPQSTDDRLHCISTIILSTWTSSQASGSGFFFQELASRDPQKEKAGEGEWRRIEQVWLVTNRHVLGVFSGEPFRQSRPIETDAFTIISKEGYNVGIVWYASLVLDIVENGKRLK